MFKRILRQMNPEMLCGNSTRMSLLKEIFEKPFLKSRLYRMESLDFAYTHTELDAEQRADGPDVHRAAVVQQPQDHFRRAVPREDWRVLSKFVRSISEILLGLIRNTRMRILQRSFDGVTYRRHPSRCHRWASFEKSI